MAHTYKRLKGKGATDFPRLDQAHPYDQYNNQYPYDGMPGEGHGETQGLRYKINSISLCTVKWSLESDDRPYWPTIENHGNGDVMGAEARDQWFSERSDTYVCEEALAPLPDDTIKVDIPYEKSLNYNYLIINGFRQHEDGDTWLPDRRRQRYFYFITDTEFVAQDTTRIHVVLDAWTTYLMFDAHRDTLTGNTAGDIEKDAWVSRPIRISRVMLEQGHAPVAMSYTDSDKPFQAGKMDYLTGIEPYAPSTDSGVVSESTFTPYGMGPDYLVLAIKGDDRLVGDYRGHSDPLYTRISSRGLILDDDDDGTTPLVHVEEPSGDTSKDIGDHPGYSTGYWKGGPFDVDPGTTGGTSGSPEDIGYSALAVRKSASDVLIDHFRAMPAMYNRIAAAFILPETVLFPNGDLDKSHWKLTSGRITEGTIYRLPRYTDSIVASIVPSKDQFHYPEQYRDLSKLYTMPYAWFEVTDGNGTTATIKVEDVYDAKLDQEDISSGVSVTEDDYHAGGMRIREQVSLIYPYLQSKIFLQGVKGGDHAKFKFRQVTQTDPQTPPDSTWNAFTQWEIPVYGLWADEGSMKAAESRDTYHANAMASLLAYRTSRQGALTSFNNSVISTNVENRNANRSINNSYDNRGMEISTAYNNGVNSAETNFNNTAASISTAWNNTNRSADTGYTNTKASNSTAFDNAKDSAWTGQTNTVNSANASETNATNSANTGRYNAKASAQTEQGNARRSASTSKENTNASNNAMLANTDANIATSTWTTAKSNSTLQNAANNNITLLQNYGIIDSDLTQAVLKSNTNSTVAMNNLNNANSVISGGVNAAGAALSGNAGGAVSSLASTAMSSATSAMSLETILTNQSEVAQAGVTANYQKWKTMRGHTNATTYNNIENSTAINDKMNSNSKAIANRNANTSNANTNRSADTSVANTNDSTGTAVDNAWKTADTSIANAERSASTSRANARRSADTSIGNTKRSTDTSNDNAWRSTNTTKANASDTQGTASSNNWNSLDTTLRNLQNTRNTSSYVNSNNRNTSRANQEDSWQAALGNEWNSLEYGRGVQQDALGIDWMRYASGITDARRGPQREVSSASGDAAPDIWRQRGIQVRAMRQPDDVIRRCGDQMLLHGYTWGGVLEGDGFERPIKNLNGYKQLYPYMDTFVYVKGEPMIYPDDERVHNSFGIFVKPSPEAIEQVRNLYRRGVTIWMDPDQIGGDIYNNEPVLEAK